MVFAACTIDNIPTADTKTPLFRALVQLLRKSGWLVIIVCTPEIYWHEWASFSSQDLPENRHVPEGGRVRITMPDVPDRRPVEDIVWSDAAYRHVFQNAGLHVLQKHQPLGLTSEPYRWVSELSVPA